MKSTDARAIVNNFTYLSFCEKSEIVVAVPVYSKERVKTNRQLTFTKQKNEPALSHCTLHCSNNRRNEYEHLTVILQTRTEYRVTLSRQGRSPSGLKSGDILQD